MKKPHSKKGDKEDTSWQKVSGWYEGLLSGEDTYQTKVILPNLKRILKPSKEERILDVACGQGLFAHEIVKEAQEVVGIDAAPDLVEIAAKGKASNETFLVMDAEKISLDKIFDKAFCVLAIQNIRNIEEVFKGVRKALKEEGTFVLVLNHPAFRIPQFSDWGYDEKKKLQYRKVFKYLSEMRVDIDMNPGSKEGKKKTVSFHRPLQYYFKTLHKTGFNVARLEEWISHKESQKGPKKAAEDNARKEIPMFMMIEAIKIIT